MTTTSIRPDRHDPTAAPEVALLGTGRMGAPMAANLARGGPDVRAWNRTANHAEALAADPATIWHRWPLRLAARAMVIQRQTASGGDSQ
jgi:3-hydroxyisobutyrate dehydrogenase-like beta-hydroxyacid dehydrogenase